LHFIIELVEAIQVQDQDLTASSVRGTRLEPPGELRGEFVPRRSGRFAVVSDLQRTSNLEFWRESNRNERGRIIRQIAEEAPDFVALLGDLVFYGSSVVDWAEFDDLSTPLRAAEVPVLPLLGNHEYWGSRRSGLGHFFGRFPHLGRRHWYSITYGPLGLVFLDSNIRRLSAARWQEQLGWYNQELGRFEENPGVLGALVLLHHPPYTNSTLAPDDLHVQRSFVPAFRSSGKTLAMVCGHVHSYERFERAGKTFLVTGGGGPRVRLAAGQRRRHPDDLFNGPPLRFFHFLIFAPSPSGLKVEMRGLQEGGRGFETMDRFTLQWAQGASPHGS
jgi:3',5'-cyclic AMP phosphodiesterase CpdA